MFAQCFGDNAWVIRILRFRRFRVQEYEYD